MEEQNNVTAGITSPPERKTVEVNKEALDKILKLVETQKVQLETQQQSINMLVATADKGRMSRYQTAQGVDLVRTVKVSFLGNKMIVGWTTVKDDVYKDMGGVWHEIQITEVVTDDGVKVEMPYSEFAKVRKEDVEIISRAEDNKGHVIFKLRYPARPGDVYSGKEFELDAIFVN